MLLLTLILTRFWCSRIEDQAQTLEPAILASLLLPLWPKFLTWEILVISTVVSVTSDRSMLSTLLYLRLASNMTPLFCETLAEQHIQEWLLCAQGCCHIPQISSLQEASRSGVSCACYLSGLIVLDFWCCGLWLPSGQQLTGLILSCFAKTWT